MKQQNIALADIVPNPWRDMEVYPINDEHVQELRTSMKQHGFFGGIKGRRRNGKVELGCGHQRIAAARKESLDTVPIFIDDIDDDQMLRLMVDENATQQGYSGAAVLADVGAVVRRLADALLDPDQEQEHVRTIVRTCFESRKSFDISRALLLAGKKDPNRSGGLGVDLIRCYLGGGKPDKASRGERQIREALTTLRQSGRYDEIIDDELAKHPQPGALSGEKDKAVIEKGAKRPKVFDDRCTAVFPSAHQAQAFREAVTTEGGKRFIGVSEQLPLAKKIMNPANYADFEKKQRQAPYIKQQVKYVIDDAVKAQRDIDKEEKERFLREQVEEQIDSELHSARASVRSLISAMAKISVLAEKYPHHPKIGGFGAKLDELARIIKTFTAKLD